MSIKGKAKRLDFINSGNIKICFFQCYYTDYIRSQTLLEGLYQQKVDIIICMVNSSTVFRYPKAIINFIKCINRVDVVIANFRCWEIMPLLRLVTRKPIIYDAHVSIWQSYCEERKKCKPDSPLGKLLYAIDRINCQMAALIIIDTKAHAAYFSETFKIPLSKFLPIYISCETSVFQPREVVVSKQDEPTRIFWVGSGIPLQGLDVIIEAMKLLQGLPVHLRLAGASPIIKEMESRAKVQSINNISFVGRIPRESVAAEISNADICLGGHYSAIPKARNVIAGKLYEMIAMRKPVIAGDNPAVRELFTHGKDIFLCEMGSPSSLVDAITTLHDQPELRKTLAENSYRLFKTVLNPKDLTAPIVASAHTLLARKASSSSSE